MKHLLLVFFALANGTAFAQKQVIVESKDFIPLVYRLPSPTAMLLLTRKQIDYTAYTGNPDLRNDTGELIAKVFFTYYKKDGEAAGKRPVTFTFNSGPGFSSVMLNIIKIIYGGASSF